MFVTNKGLPEGEVARSQADLPDVVSHATNVVEHAELGSDRSPYFANIVGRERVIASADCRLDSRVHSQIDWAKLEALAGRQLWH